MTNVLYLSGGWSGHQPYRVADWACGVMDDLGFRVETIHDPYRLEDDLTAYDLIVLGWTSSLTTESLSDEAGRRLLEAVTGGTGIAGWHGMTAAFRGSLPYHFLVGGAFVEHPGGDAVTYQVTIVDHDHPVTHGVENFELTSEQYYMQVDPAVHVLAATTFTGECFPWVEGVVMPAAYVKQFGEGRVFYVSPGHDPEELRVPEVERMVRQGMGWAARGE
jgi:type 1 glutamine amidotransferase